jgi:hypothetical protein
VSKDKYGYVSVEIRVFRYKNDVEQVFYVPDLAEKNLFVVMPEEKDCWC